MKDIRIQLLKARSRKEYAKRRIAAMEKSLARLNTRRTKMMGITESIEAQKLKLTQLKQAAAAMKKDGPSAASLLRSVEKKITVARDEILKLEGGGTSVKFELEGPFLRELD